ncbi:MAG: PPOX class F420-dependent oxidoreductase [Ilumatobacteraceae bacterium]|nr:PPOX class F420-dependent oxidoreductase [Acidimicrobiales bacterium]
MTAEPTRTLADEKYVVLTTTRKDGRSVPTPVWIAALPDGALGFTTELSSGKVKRIRNFPDVTLQPSNARGVVKPGTTPVVARATVLTDQDVGPVETAIRAKYGLWVPLINAAYEIGRIVRRRPKHPGAGIRLELR